MIEYLFTNFHWTGNEKMKLISERIEELVSNARDQEVD